MKLHRLWPALALAALAGCATTPADPAPTFYVMRHLQKASATDPDPPLSAEGRANAERVYALVEANPPSAIYASPTRRAMETAAPLAARLGLTTKTYDPRDTPGLAARVQAETGSVLIVGHSNTVPGIVAALGGTRPADLTEEDYGDVWVIARDSGATVKKSLGGD